MTQDFKESKLLDQRRQDTGSVSDMADAGGQPRYRALAFSGGGIRSATFSLGVLEAIAKDKNPAPGDPDKPGRLYRASRLSTFDYLSTVSGGGYLGGFLCSLFQPNRLRNPTADPKTVTDTQVNEAADDAVRVLTSGPPGRIRAAGPFEGDDVLAAPMAWLRENGRYLMPTGVGDAFYAAALGIRNWLALHYVIGTVLIMLLALVGWSRAWAFQHFQWVKQWDLAALNAVIGAGSSGSAIERIWWSPLFPLALAPVVLLGIPLGIAFWLVNERRDGRSWPLNLAVLGCVGVATLLVGAGLAEANHQAFLESLFNQVGPHGETGRALIRQAEQQPAWAGGLELLGAITLYLGLALAVGLPLKIMFWLAGPGQHRSAGLQFAMVFALLLSAMVAIGLVQDSGEVLWRSLLDHGQAKAWPHYLQRHPAVAGGLEVMIAIFIYFALGLATRSASVQRVHLTRWLAWVLVGTAGIIGLAIVDTLGQTLYFLATHGASSKAPALAPVGLVTALVWLSRHFAAKDSSAGLPDWLKKLPTRTLAGFAGILIFVLVGALWSLFVHWLVWEGSAPNLKGSFQGAEHMQAQLQLAGVGLFLSVVTGLFPGFINLSSLQAFYSSRLTRAYLGASNGERFKEHGAGLSAAEPLPKDNLAMEDYFGPPNDSPDDAQKLKTRAPLHIINITVNKTVDPAEQLVQRDRKGQPMAVLPLGFSIDGHWRDGFPRFRLYTEVKKRLGVGQWIGTSGAAFSTGIGRETSLGMSLLMAAANVRLGTWWESGMAVTKQRGIADLLRRTLGAMFRTQSYLSYELRARFFGTHRQWQYLSDGGHFENTAIYELLRKDRRVFQIFGCDNGADPQYRFEDLANLIRLARIDLKVELTVQSVFAGDLAKVFADREVFKRMSEFPKPADDDEDEAARRSRHTPCALLLWARRLGEDRPSTQIVLFKPNVVWDATADVRQYAVEHPAFPQEPTADQFFDEAQWESYRSLGYHLGRKVFNAKVMTALHDLARQEIDGIAPPTP